jgi:hypothetical protein
MYDTRLRSSSCMHFCLVGPAFLSCTVLVAPNRLALGMLQFYKVGISPLMPSSCRYLPTCSEYSMQSYKRFGRCNFRTAPES